MNDTSVLFIESLNIQFDLQRGYISVVMKDLVMKRCVK